MALGFVPASTGLAPGASLASTRPSAALSTWQYSRRSADFGAGSPTEDARQLADWVADSRDNASAPFIIVDKRVAQLHVFDAEARWVASTAVLLGAALGDESVPGIGSRPIASIQASERTTPAGRFLGEPGRNASGEDVIWVDYEAAVSMHRVRLTNPGDHRAERLASPSAADNRISYGCINVPVLFYERHIQAIFVRHRAFIYVLPDSMSMQKAFGTHPAARPTPDGLLSFAADRTANNHTDLQQFPR